MRVSISRMQAKLGEGWRQWWWKEVEMQSVQDAHECLCDPLTIATTWGQSYHFKSGICRSNCKRPRFDRVTSYRYASHHDLKPIYVWTCT